MKKLIVLIAFAIAGTLAQAATLFISAYPNVILVFDEAKGQVVDRIPLSTGLPTGMRLSFDRKKIYVITNDHSGVETIDVATHKVINHFVLNTADKRYRFYAGTPDPENKVLYTITTEIDKRKARSARPSIFRRARKITEAFALAADLRCRRTGSFCISSARP
jgi:hypothetical protein